MNTKKKPPTIKPGVRVVTTRGVRNDISDSS